MNYANCALCELSVSVESAIENSGEVCEHVCITTLPIDGFKKIMVEVKCDEKN